MRRKSRGKTGDYGSTSIRVIGCRRQKRAELTESATSGRAAREVSAGTGGVESLR